MIRQTILTYSIILATVCSATVVASSADYVIVVSQSTNEDAQWKPVVQALQRKHDATVVTFDQGVAGAREALQQSHPKYTCFVAKPTEATRQFVADVHQLTRKIDDDPYTDTFWGILTGYDAANALRIAKHGEPLTINKVAGGTEFAMEMVEQGLWYDELVKGKMVAKTPGSSPKQEEVEADTTAALVNSLNDYQPDLFITSGHATERDWMIGFTYRNGFFKSKAGQMFGEDTQKQKIEVDSDNPKVYLPIGNCLMGHIDGPDAMALAWMNDAGVNQMIGYTVPTWFGYQGWGVLDYFVEQPGRYTMTEAFFANHHALIYNIENKIGNEKGMTFDRDVVAFYGNPAWQATMADREKAYGQELTVEDGVYTLTITGNRGEDSFKPVNTNGSQRGWRPIVQFLPHRVRDIEIIAGDDLKPVIADDFILVPNPREYVETREYVVKFRAKPIN